MNYHGKIEIDEKTEENLELYVRNLMGFSDTMEINLGLIGIDLQSNDLSYDGKFIKKISDDEGSKLMDIILGVEKWQKE